MSRRQLESEAVDTSHLDDVEDGCGCTEIWEHLSEGRERDESAEERSAEAERRRASRERTEE